MLISKSKLKKIIKEEAQKILEDMSPQGLIDLVAAENAAMERDPESVATRDLYDWDQNIFEMGPQAYADWKEAYEDESHPDHFEAVSALPAVNPTRYMYPTKLDWWNKIISTAQPLDDMLNEHNKKIRITKFTNIRDYL